MAKREEELIISSLADRWSATHNPAIGVTAVANVNSQFTTNGLGNKYRHNLTSLSYSLKGANAAVAPMTLSVRDGSIGGTVRAQWDFILGIAGSVQGTFANL